jgi:hypothetical protein
VLDLLRRTDRAELPPALWRFVDRREGYDYAHHARTGAAHGDFVDDETCDRFCLLGPLEAHLARLRELEAAGATQVNLYLLAPGKEALVEAYGRNVIPVLGGVKA